MDKGYIKLILMLANFVLKDIEVNSSIKELALAVTQDILESNDKIENIQLIRVTINMMKSNYISDNLNSFLKMLLRRSNISEIAVMCAKITEYEPIPRSKFL